MNFPFYGFEVEVEVRDDAHRAVRRLVAGKRYGHIVKTTDYERLEDLDLEVISKLDDDTKQLNFEDGGKTWTCTMLLERNDPEKKETRVLECISPKSRPRDRITVSIASDPPLPPTSPKIDDFVIK